MTLGCREVSNVIEQPSVASRPNLGEAKLTMIARLNLTPQLKRHSLHAVTDTKNGKPTLKNKFGCLVCLIIVGAGVTARKDDALH